MSAPALKARSPAPVRTTQRQVPRSSSSHNRARSVIICRDIALSLTWWSMVTITTCGPCARARISMSARLQSRDDDDLAVRPALGQEPDRLDAFLERKTVRDARPELAGLVPLEKHGPHYGLVARYWGGRRAFVACSNAWASLTSVGSLQARPMNVIPTGRPIVEPAGTLMSG